MEKLDWAKIDAVMDQRLELKYQQLPSGEQIGQRKQSAPAQIEKS